MLSTAAARGHFSGNSTNGERHEKDNLTVPVVGDITP